MGLWLFLLEGIFLSVGFDMLILEESFALSSVVKIVLSFFLFVEKQHFFVPVKSIKF